MLENEIKKYVKRLKQSCDCDYQCGCKSLDAYQVASFLEKLLPEEGKMITAAEARKQVMEKVEGQAKIWLENAEAKIKQALIAKSMYVYCPYDSGLYVFCRKELEKLGYDVSTIGGGCGGGPMQVKISWEEKTSVSGVPSWR